MSEKGRMTVSEAGHCGGKATSERHGHEFYVANGKKGGTATSKKYGHEFYSRIGHKGRQIGKELIAKSKA